ncbi:uncharacterized protein KQ657_004888 [Scheffersomyces spartinae]|uniref:Origin recognition complex subunit 4 C-terminal domain-containing protein n=1 Tax=Scheffersomyces spartinae TaxID=45513 RepID=A0A9P7VA61_9ASCO|nr:uncharacterized protein KQ657_004888 [Scheffersomyces spartinae]KAG7194179.1 hypothetical protein KQ657_004888 [Scheffersomyces spartinae]
MGGSETGGSKRHANQYQFERNQIVKKAKSTTETELIQIRKVYETDSSSSDELFNGDHSDEGNIQNDISGGEISLESSSSDISGRSTPIHEPTTISTTSEQQHGVATKLKTTITTATINDDDFNVLKRQVISQLNGRSKFPNLHKSSLANHYHEITKMFEYCVEGGEGHSLLLIGPRASGKSCIVDAALELLADGHVGNSFITVRLNAYMHGDDRVALREIARQLDQNYEIEGGFERWSTSETFTNILKILETNIFKTEQQEEAQEELETNKEYEEDLQMSIIFIIDEFEKFTNNSKQTLLYNLFDMSQYSATPICVVGMSTKVTTREMLEKRVKSRFSQRVISINKPSTIEEFWQDFKLNLIVSEELVQHRLKDIANVYKWNKQIEDLYETSNSPLKKLVLENYFTVKNFKHLANACLPAIVGCHDFKDLHKFENFTLYQKVNDNNNIQNIIGSLSYLETLLVIAAARWVAKSEIPIINFNLAYAEYQAMIKSLNLQNSSAASSNLSAIDSTILASIKVNQKIWSPVVLRNSWETLYKCGILLDSAGVTTNSEGNIITNVNKNKSYTVEENKMIQLDVTLQELNSIFDSSSIFNRFTKL